jgi:cytochrome P450
MGEGNVNLPAEMGAGLLPPMAPGKLPVLGHLLAFRRSPHNFLQQNCREMGSIFSFQLFHRTFYVLNHPDFVKHVLVNNAKNYSRKSSYHFLEEILGEGLLTIEGELWRKRRRMMQPAFSKEQMRLLVGQVETSIRDFTKRYASKTGETLDLDTEMNQLTLMVLTNSIIQTELADRFVLVKQNLFLSLKYLTTNRFKALKWTTRLPSLTKYRGQKSIRLLKAIVMNIIVSRRASTATHSDLLAMVMAAKDEETGAYLTNEELLDEVMTMFVAGHDTTSVVLTWTLYLLARHPDIEAKLVAEIRAQHSPEPQTIESLMAYPYLRMVIQESMRLYPPVWSFGRKAVQADQMLGYHVPAGTSCTMPALFVHRHPDFWEQPNAFYPEHFLPEQVKAREKLAYFPFSAGQHRCIGEHYAIMEIQLALIELLNNYTVKLASATAVDPLLLVTLKPQQPIRFQFHKRP